MNPPKFRDTSVTLLSKERGRMLPSCALSSLSNYCSHLRAQPDHNSYVFSVELHLRLSIPDLSRCPCYVNAVPHKQWDKQQLLAHTAIIVQLIHPVSVPRFETLSYMNRLTYYSLSVPLFGGNGMVGSKSSIVTISVLVPPSHRSCNTSTTSPQS